MSSEPVDVVVVGCGPVGAITANFLGQYGLRTLIIDREITPHSQPRAFSCDDETQRNFRLAGMVQELAVNVWPCKSMDYIDSEQRKLAAAVFSEVDFGNGFTALGFFNQPQMEGVLRQGLKRFPHVELRMGQEVESFIQDSEGVNVNIKDRFTGRQRTVRARYLLGCDGARSSIRKLMGVEMSGTSYKEPWITITATVPPTERDFTYYVCDPVRPGFAARSGPTEVRMDFLLSENERVEVIENKGFVEKLLSRFVDPSHILTIQRAAVFTFSSKVAEQWRSGRVFLLGDAAHLMPPFMGQGLCSGIRDSINLSWKLAAVLRGAAGEALLDTYERERRPHATNMIKATIMMGKVFLARSRFIASVRNRVMQWLWKNPRTQYLLREFKAKPPILIDHGFLAGGRYRKGAAEGTYFPQPRVGLPGRAEPALLDEALGQGFAVLQLAGVDEPVRQAAEALAREVQGTLLRVLPAERASEARPGEVVDVEGKLAAWFTRFHADTVLVRPDRYVFGATHGPGLEKVREQVRAFIHPVDTSRSEPAPARSQLSSIA